MNSISDVNQPVLPAAARLPLLLVPNRLKTIVITRALNSLFATALAEDELEFLDGRFMNVCINDAGISFSVTLKNDRLRAHRAVSKPDLSIEGTTYTFLLLGTRREDADTLFFHRRLKTQGDTELGLYLKNFLDGLETETLPLHRILDPLMRQSLVLADHYQRMINR